MPRFISGFVQDFGPRVPTYSVDTLAWNFRPYRSLPAQLEAAPPPQEPQRPILAIELNSLLIAYSHKNLLNWDMNEPLHLYPESDYGRSVATRSCWEMSIDVVFEDIRTRRYPNDLSFQTIHVVPQRDSSYITVRDVLEAIYNHFHARLPDEKRMKFALDDPLFDKKFNVRVDTIKDPRERASERVHGPRWIDFVNYFTGEMDYPGLALAEMPVKFGVCRAELTFAFQEEDDED